MIRIFCAGRTIELSAGETVLDALLRAGVAVAHSCRAGACQSCLARAVDGAPPAAAQRGLRRDRAEQGYFLACQAVPDGDLAVTFADVEQAAVGAVIESATRMAADVVRLTLAPEAPFEYRAGQFLTLVRPGDGLSRSYSLASLPGVDAGLELHVRVMPGGAMSGWLAGRDVVGRRVRVRGPAGDCFYDAGDGRQPILLAGVGTGLAPLLGVLKDALRQGHSGPITLVHGARKPEGLYLVDELRDLASRHRAQLEYVPCALEPGPGPRVEIAPIDRVIFDKLPSLAGYRVFLCGDSDLVLALRKRAFLAGARLADIHADAFVTAPPPPRAGALASN